METYKQLTREEHGFDMGVYHADSTSTVIEMVKANGCRIEQCESHVNGSKSGAEFVGRTFYSASECMGAEVAAWRPGLTVIEDMITKLRTSLPAPVSRRRKPRWQIDDGSDVCLDRLRSGQEFWREAARLQTSGPSTITVVTDMATSSYVESKDILWRGAAAVAMTHVLEEAGYRVELLAASAVLNSYASHNGGRPVNACNVITLKDSGQPVDLSTLTNWVSGWMYRTAWWMWANCHGTPSYGYGYPCPLKNNPKIVRALTPDENVCVISDCWNEKAAISQTKAFLTKLTGVPVPA